jgi:cysteine-rich repeat protein
MRIRSLALIALVALPFAPACSCDSTDDDVGGGGTGATGGGGEGATGATTTVGGGGEGATGAQGGTGGGGGTPVSDTCPGTELTVGTMPAVATGTTVGAKSDYQSFCSDTVGATGSNPDVVYTFDVAAECSFTGTLSNLGFDASISLRKGVCDDRVPGDQCLNASTGNGDEVVRASLKAGTYFLVIDGATATGGNFTLTTACPAASCGDGVLNTGEECDPGAPMAGDGCIDPGLAGECNFEPGNPALETCPGLAIGIPKGADFRTPDVAPLRTTLNAIDNYAPTACDTDVGGRDHVYSFTTAADITGSVTITLGEDTAGVDLCTDPLAITCWDRVLYVRTGDCATGTQIACSNDPLAYEAMEAVTFPVLPNTVYSVFVDGYYGMDDAAGPYSLHVVNTP